jgi:hypothetical protein
LSVAKISEGEEEGEGRRRNFGRIRREKREKLDGWTDLGYEEIPWELME